MNSKSAKVPSKGIVKSSWTPLSNEEANFKVFEERRNLVNKWFDQWNNNQRQTVLTDVLTKCTANQTDYARMILNTRAAQNHVDFSRSLPRILCLYIFTFLDPRSLCRASQVCWYWKYLTEANEVWAPKCLRLGWYVDEPINSMEQGLWKKQFIKNVIILQLSRPNKEKELKEKLLKELTALELERIEHEESERRIHRLREKQKRAQQMGTRPWKGPDPRPIDIVRNNYIDNDVNNGAKVKLARPDSRNGSIRRLSSYDRKIKTQRTQRPSSAQRAASTKIVHTDRPHTRASVIAGDRVSSAGVGTNHSGLRGDPSTTAGNLAGSRLTEQITNDNSRPRSMDQRTNGDAGSRSMEQRTNSDTGPRTNDVINYKQQPRLAGEPEKSVLVVRNIANSDNVPTVDPEIPRKSIYLEDAEIPSGRPWILPVDPEES